MTAVDLFLIVGEADISNGSAPLRRFVDKRVSRQTPSGFERRRGKPSI